MIYTLTLNPSVDYYLDSFQANENGIHKAMNAQYLPGGKGLNVSMVLDSFSMESTAICLLGGFTGDFIEKEISCYSHIHLKRFTIPGTTRINVKISSDEQEYDFNGTGDNTDLEVIDSLLAYLQENVTEKDFLVICGSFPKGMDEEFLKKIQIKGKMIIDISAVSLETLNRVKPYLIKPNQQELDKILAGKEISQCQVENILLSLGGDGARFYGQKSYQIIQPSLKVVSTIGCGDSMLAGFIAGEAMGRSTVDCLKLAAACGMQAVGRKGLADGQTVNEFLNSVKVEEI